MVTQVVTIKNQQGMHMRPANVFATSMIKYQSEITLKKDDQTINGKSLMNIMAACIKCGAEIEICCEGADEEAMLKEAVELIESGFGE